jgi:hypothetical protein
LLTISRHDKVAVAIESGGKALDKFTFGSVRFDPAAEAYRFSVAHRGRTARCSISLQAIEEMCGERTDLFRPLDAFKDNEARVQAIAVDQYVHQNAFSTGLLKLTVLHVICASEE